MEDVRIFELIPISNPKADFRSVARSLNQEQIHVLSTINGKLTLLRLCQKLAMDIYKLVPIIALLKEKSLIFFSDEKLADELLKKNSRTNGLKALNGNKKSPTVVEGAILARQRSAVFSDRPAIERNAASQSPHSTVENHRISESKKPIENLFMLLMNLAKEHFSGAVRIHPGNGNTESTKKIFLEDGAIVDIVNEPFDQNQCLGQILLKQGRLSFEAFIDSLENMQRTGKRQGEVLLDMGYADKNTLMDALWSQAEQKLCDVFKWENLETELERKEISIDKDHQSVPLPRLIYRVAVHCLPDEQIIKSFTSDTFIQRSIDPLVDPDECGLEPTIKHLLKEYLESPISIQKLSEQTGIEKQALLKEIYALILLGLADRVR